MQVAMDPATAPVPIFDQEQFPPELEVVPDPPRAAADGLPSRSRVLRGRSSFIEVEVLADPVLPRVLVVGFIAMYAMLAVLAAHQLFGFGGATFATLINHWFNNAVFIGAGLATAWRAIAIPSERVAWSVVAAAVLLYCSGDVAWTMFFAESEAPVTPADALYLGFAPLMFVGIVLLVRSRINRFELDRWIDGIAAALLVAAPGVVLILEPTIRASEGSLLVKAVSVAYPLNDIVLLGAVVGVIALAGWRPGRAWVTLALGLSCFVAADAFYSVENLTGTYSLGGAYEFLWPAAALLVATAAWMQPLRHRRVHAWGWRAIALPVLCQTAPIALLFLKDDPPSEQLLMSAVLAIVLVQLVVTRPRRPATID